MQRPGRLPRIIDAGGNVILEILADPAQRHPHRDAVMAERVRIADAREHQKLRRVDDAAAQDHFALGMRGESRSALDEFDACGAASVEHDAAHKRIRLDCEIGSRQRRAQIGLGSAAAAAVLDRHLAGAEAFLLSAVEIRVRPVARRDTGRGEGVD